MLKYAGRIIKMDARNKFRLKLAILPQTLGTHASTTRNWQLSRACGVSFHSQEERSRQTAVNIHKKGITRTGTADGPDR